MMTPMNTIILYPVVAPLPIFQQSVTRNNLFSPSEQSRKKSPDEKLYFEKIIESFKIKSEIFHRVFIIISIENLNNEKYICKFQQN